MRNYSNSLVRSITRITLLEYCSKKYYFKYYTWALKNVDQKLRSDTILLKNLKSLEMRVGEKTHHILSDYLHLLQSKEATPENINLLKEKIRQNIQEEFEISKNRKYENVFEEERFGLTEHYYWEDVDAKLEPCIQKVMNNLDIFIASERNEKVQRYFDKAQKVFIENPRNQNFEAMKVIIPNIPELKNVTIMASPDFGVVFNPSKYLIIDWKSGKEKNDFEWVSDQIKVYALKSFLKTWLKFEDVEISWYEVYLPSLNQFGGKITKEDIDYIQKKLVEDVSFQKQFIQDWDEIRNEPLASSKFLRTKSEKKCQICTFRKVCEELKSYELKN